MMCVFVMMYSALYDDFLVYVFDRLIDIGLGVIFGVLVFSKIWPRFSHDNLKPLVSKELQNLSAILGILQGFLESKSAINTQEIQAKSAELLHSIEELKNTLRDSKAEKKGQDNQIVVYGFELIDTMQSAILKVNELSLLCSTQNDIESSSLEINDLKLLQTRFDMINDMIKGNTYYFRFNADALLSDKTTHFYKLINEIFNNQNTLYNLLNENHITAP